ncbi:arginine--tRNA ligase [Desulfogranum mediterraneum]|uniref:arginine--tRNA ligase n=1 Tax=Desulfogranum mediterraneum TaxID=160661 RepID=UPI0004205FA1|nr:arginine--tRNA ligase [Desulfogranum mediterraneum]
MIKSQVKAIVDRFFEEGVSSSLWSDRLRDRYSVEVPKHQGQGDFATNLAMVGAGIEKCNPRELAARFIELAGEDHPVIERWEIAGPGFINIFLKKSIWTTILAEINRQGEGFGLSRQGQGKRVLVEFVSANPTGPLSVGHGRNAIIGDSVARLLEATGFQVHREYYFNDAGRQMRVLGESTRARYLEELELEHQFPEDGYQGSYITDIADQLVQESGAELKDAPVEFFKEKAKEAIFADIDATLKRIGIAFDSYFNEHTLYEDGLIDDVVQSLKDQDLVYEQEGAVWFKTSALGLEQDRVIIKSSGEPTYRLPDIAYHREKFKRGFDWMINVFGSDHIATVPDVLAGVRALGYDDELITVILYQFVTLLRGGKQVKMSTRKATFVTIDELVDEVGVDALRFFFLMRKPDSQLEFDLDLAKKQSQENPVYYVQYGHARLCSIQRQAAEQGVSLDFSREVELGLLDQEEEYHLLKTMADYPGLVADAATDLAPHRLIFFLMELAGNFHSYYNKHKVLSDDRELSAARLYLCHCVKTVLKNGLTLLGITAPERM